jgi:ABC-2 type transport system permease protein
MRTVLTVSLQEFRILLRDRQALALLFVMPMIFIVFITLALKDIYLTKVGRKIKLAVVSKEVCDSPEKLCTGLIDALKLLPYEVKVVPAIDRIKGSEVALVLPKSLEETYSQLKHGVETEKIQLLFDPLLDQSLRALVAAHLQVIFQKMILTEVLPKGRMPPAFEQMVEQKALGGMVLPNPIEQTVPAWTLFGMFFIVIPMANSILRDRRHGLFKRLLSFPVRPSQILIGKVLPYFVINNLQFFCMFLLALGVLPRWTGFDLKMDFAWGGLVLITLACAIAATSYGVMVACLVRTADQASAFGALSVVILAVLGGVMIPRFVMPEFMQGLAKMSPLYWGLESYLDLLVRKSGPEVFIPKLIWLLAFAAVCLLVGRFRFRWSEMT